MNFFESELRKIAANCENIHDPKFVGRACIGRLTDEVTVKMSMVYLSSNENYDGLEIVLINRHEGCIDKLCIRFGDIWGTFLFSGSKIVPHTWTNNGVTKWYCLSPTSEQIQQLSNAVDAYLESFTEPELTESEDMDISM